MPLSSKTALLMLFTLISFSGMTQANTWQPVTSSEQLQQIVSGPVRIVLCCCCNAFLQGRAHPSTGHNLL